MVASLGVIHAIRGSASVNYSQSQSVYTCHSYSDAFTWCQFISSFNLKYFVLKGKDPAALQRKSPVVEHSVMVSRLKKQQQKNPEAEPESGLLAICHDWLEENRKATK